MKGKIVTILLCMLMLSTVAGSLPSADKSIKQSENETKSSEISYSHNIIGEYFTLSTCETCKYIHRALKNLYAGEYHPFFYITMVFDENWGNKWAKQRHEELKVYASPAVVWDGPYIKDQGSKEDVEEDMADLNVSIIACGNRNVKDIDLNLSVDWLGAVNNFPEDGATLVPIEQHMTWTNSEMEIDVEVTSHESDQYNGHLHVYVNEVNSTLWDDKWGDPYTHAFLDYAWNQDVTISASSSWDDTDIWDGYEHNTGYSGEYYQDFGNITQDNIIVIASIFDEDNNDYADETTGIRTGYDTDPKYFNVYFGNTTPPPKVAENQSGMEWFNKSGPLEWDTTYYWQVDIWDNNGDFFPGEEWIFITRGNDPPNDPGWEYPINRSIDIPIEVNLSWICNDPDGDDLTFDVWFGDEFNINQVAWNQTENWFVIEDLDFVKRYYWYIVAWEVDYDLYTVGTLWNFLTEANIPPNPAVDSYPVDGDPAVPTEGVALEWNGSDDNYGDTLRYDLYFDDVNPPQSQQLWESYDDFWEIEFPLTKYKTYYWKVDTYDKMGEFTEGNVWEFSCGDNTPPTDPIINGPTTGGKNKIYNFTFMSTDLENHSIKYQVKWGDGSEDTTELLPNGTTATLSHSWDKVGDKTIQARAIDQYGLMSDWSTFTITIPRNKIFNLKLLELLFSHFPSLFPLLQKLL
jgi:hypothetical protein